MAWLSPRATVLAAPLMLLACENSAPQARSEAPPVVATSTSSSEPRDANPAGQMPVSAHDPANPPIDCPLKAQGIDPHGLKPFEDVSKYISFLEREDRAIWQKPDAVVSALELRGDETVADVGAGSGYFSFRFAKQLDRGSVVAIDVEAEMIRHVHHKAMTSGVNNIQVKLAEKDDPSVPADADLVFICDVLHHVKGRPAWLKKLHGQMKAGSRLALIEFKEGPLPEGPPESLKISKADMVAELTAAGFEAAGEKADLLPYQYLLLFSRR